MVNQADILLWMALEVRQGRPVGVVEVTQRFGLTTDAAAGHLMRLWRDRLIGATSPRPPRYRFRLCPEERIGSLHFQLVVRGRERLRWYLEQAEAASSR
jgi:hypothetical protein